MSILCLGISSILLKIKNKMIKVGNRIIGKGKKPLIIAEIGINHFGSLKLAKKIGKKVIISPLGYLEPWSLEQSKIKKKIAWYLYQKNILEKADCIHVTSQQELNSLNKLISSKEKSSPPKHIILKFFFNIFDLEKAIIKFLKFLYLPLAPTKSKNGLS